MAKAEQSAAKPQTGDRRTRGKKMRSDRAAAIAEEEELLRVLTQILRGELTEDNAVKMRGEDGEYVEIVKLRPKISTVVHCVELLGKVYGTFGEQKEDGGLPTVIFGEEDLE